MQLFPFSKNPPHATGMNPYLMWEQLEADSVVIDDMKTMSAEIICREDLQLN